jgi:hypothetical protein
MLMGAAMLVRTCPLDEDLNVNADLSADRCCETTKHILGTEKF